ncbi:MAG TPA: excinuclease ABC subunit UvrC [Candidatus Hydrogenedentes bacterium]|nr:excinuclease ABC subunit UvrC [Candidatus Hydrogenedentota bacterium]
MTQKSEIGRFPGEFELSSVPSGPGCYLMKDREGRVIYVGKAKDLRARLRTYVHEQDTRHSVQFLMDRVAAIDFLVTATEKEALLLENSLIKQHSPRYNVRLKDDKTYVSLRVNVKEDFPRITVVRRHKHDGARYFGPYASAQSVRETLRQMRRIFPLRTCTDAVMRNRTRPCLYHQMNQCVAPCVGLVSSTAYHEIVGQVVLVLEGRSAEVEKLLLEQIGALAEALEFEKAAALRDRLQALRRTVERQRTVNVAGPQDRDVFGVYTRGRYTEVQVLFFRGRKMVGGRSFSFKGRESPVEEQLSSFLIQYYSGAASIPPEILIPLPVEDEEPLVEVLGEQRGGPVKVLGPQRGEKRALVELAARNAKARFEEKRLAAKVQTDLLDELKEALRLPSVPSRIECFDISTTQGAGAVGSMVAFEGGVPNKARYRRFAIRSVAGQDDFAMLREVLLRRYRKAAAEDDLPDLVLIDGGKGQLNVATTVFKDLGIEDLPAASVAKSRREGAAGRSPERFFIPGRANPIILVQSKPVVHLIARIRDEAHRFAVAYHRKRRAKATVRTALTDIPGIGPRRARMLLNKFGSIARIADVSEEAIAILPGFTGELAREVRAFAAAFRKGRTEGVEE